MLKLVRLILLILLSISPAMAAPQHLLTNADRSALNGQVQYLEDAQMTYTIDDIIRQENWLATHGEFSQGYSNSAWWLKLTLTNPKSDRREYLLEIGSPLLDYIDIYLVDAAGTIGRHYNLGDKLTYNRRPIDHHHFIVPMVWEPQQTLSLYIRVQSTSSIQVPLILWERNALAGLTNSHDIAHGLFFGAILLIAAYNLLLFFQFRDSIYLYYVCYVLAMALFQCSLTGLAFRYLWPTAIWWNDQVIMLSLISVVFFVNIFSIKLLDAPVLLRIFYLYGIVITVLATLLLSLSLVLPYAVGIKLALLLVFVGSLSGVFVGPVAWIKGISAGKYYTLAWSSLFAGTFALIFDKIGLIPTSWLTAHGLNIGVVAEVLLFSLSLSERINAERRLRFEAQQNALQAVQHAHVELEQRVAGRNRELDVLNDQLNLLSNTDQLTGLWNRRHLETLLSKEWSRSVRHGRSLAVALVDIDFFKTVNDKEGHQVGDECLRIVAQRINNCAQNPGNVAARYGGEEFCLLLIEADCDQAFAIAEGVRKAVSEAPVVVGELQLDITVSIGVSAAVPHRSVNPEWLLKRADCALYRAKKEGRNRVLLYEKKFEKLDAIQNPYSTAPSVKST